MNEALDWEPSVPLNDGLERVYEWAEGELKDTQQPTVADGGDV